LHGTGRCALTGKVIIMNASPAPKNVVLVHGGFVDGSGWQGVYGLLKNDGYNVSMHEACLEPDHHPDAGAAAPLALGNRGKALASRTASARGAR
jgi:hypothetical protein